MCVAETIYTIPLNDAFDQPDSCPLCYLQQAYAQDLERYYLGPALMEPSVRKQTNSQGFCQAHFHRLLRSNQNRLGLALILQTHLAEKQAKLPKLLAQLRDASTKRGLFRDNTDIKEKILAAIKNEESCLFCQALDERMQQYYHSLVYLYENDSEFKEKYARHQALCLPHSAELLIKAAVKMKAATSERFMREIMNAQEAQSQKLANDLQWYLDKHDYRNHGADWGESKEASRKTINLLLGEEVHESRE